MKEESMLYEEPENKTGYCWKTEWSDNYVKADKVAFVKDLDENIEAGAAPGACRIVVFFDSQKKRGAIIHMDKDNYPDLIDALLKKRKFNPESTILVCGDGRSKNSLNSEIVGYIVNKGFQNIMLIDKGKGKNVVMNVGQRRLQVTDDNNRILYPNNETEGAFYNE